MTCAAAIAASSRWNSLSYWPFEKMKVDECMSGQGPGKKGGRPDSAGPAAGGARKDQPLFRASQASISGRRALLTLMRSLIDAIVASTSPREVGARLASA